MNVAQIAGGNSRSLENQMTGLGEKKKWDDGKLMLGDDQSHCQGNIYPDTVEVNNGYLRAVFTCRFSK
ncbi:MAG: hypothetical protein JNL02_13095 [Saprospiraceae bacterium]|nr:hypothetical protein [Saprospiraceae bacterium]